MIFTIRETGERKPLRVAEWNGDAWGGDMLSGLSASHIYRPDVTLEEYESIRAHWTEQVDRHNAGEDTEEFGRYDGTEWAVLEVEK